MTREQNILSLLAQFKDLGVDKQIDYNKFCLYSLITHSTAIEGSTITEIENQLLFDEGISAKDRSMTAQLMNEDGVLLKDMVYLKRNIPENIIIKTYYGRIPACGVFCGGCPTYTRDKKPCLGAELNKDRCERCKTFHLCCVEKGITHCYQCKVFPCAKFKSFAKRWLKYGQDFINNQKLLKQVGEMEFLKQYNQKD